MPYRLKRLGMGDATPYPATVAIARAIAVAEGGLTPGTSPYRTNNPCDIFIGGNTGGYSSMQAGWDACYNQVNLMTLGGSSVYNPNMSLSTVASSYAPASAGNDPSQWASNVASALGVSPSATLAQIASSYSDDSAVSNFNLDAISDPTSQIDPTVLIAVALGLGVLIFSLI